MHLFGLQYHRSRLLGLAHFRALSFGFEFEFEFVFILCCCCWCCCSFIPGLLGRGCSLVHLLVFAHFALVFSWSFPFSLFFVSGRALGSFVRRVAFGRSRCPPPVIRAPIVIIIVLILVLVRTLISARLSVLRFYVIFYYLCSFSRSYCSCYYLGTFGVKFAQQNNELADPAFRNGPRHRVQLR